MFEESAAEEPARREPVFRKSAYDDEPAFEEPVPQEPVFQEPTFEKPVTDDPGYGRQEYEQAGYDEPMFRHPDFDEAEAAEATAVIGAWSVPLAARRARVIKAALLEAVGNGYVIPEMVADMAVGPLLEALAQVELELADARRRVDELERAFASEIDS